MAVKLREDEGDNLWDGRVQRSESRIPVEPVYPAPHLELPAFMIRPAYECAGYARA